jgi:hypothetical protein
MGEAVENIRQWLKDFTFGKKIRNFKVICSNTIIGVEDEDEAEKRRKVKEYWSSDPVHLSSAGYEKIAEDLSNKAESGLTRPVEKKREGGVMMGPSCKRARWIEEDDVTVNRSGGRGGGRGGRGRGGGRSGGRNRGWWPRRSWFGSGRGGHRGSR